MTSRYAFLRHQYLVTCRTYCVAALGTRDASPDPAERVGKVVRYKPITSLHRDKMRVSACSPASSSLSQRRFFSNCQSMSNAIELLDERDRMEPLAFSNSVCTKRLSTNSPSRRCLCCSTQAWMFVLRYDAPRLHQGESAQLDTRVRCTTFTTITMFSVNRKTMDHEKTVSSTENPWLDRIDPAMVLRKHDDLL